MWRMTLAIAAFACVALAGCGGGGRDATAETTSAQAAARPKPPPPKGPGLRHLIVKDLERGTGVVAEKGDELAVHYLAGVYNTGKETESAWHKGLYFHFILGGEEVLPTWNRGLEGMRVGGRRELIFPTTKKHVPIGSTAKDTLVYVVDLVEVNKRRREGEP